MRHFSIYFIVCLLTSYVWLYKANAIDHSISNNGKEEIAEETEYLNKALEIDPDNYGIYYGLGVAYYRKGNYVKVIEYHNKFNQYLASQNKNPQDLQAAYRNLELAFRKIGDYNKAAEYAQKALAYTGVNNLGPTFTGKENQKDIEYLMEALQINPAVADAYVDIVTTSSSGSVDYDKEIEYLEKALQINPYNFGCYYALGVVYYRKRDYKKILECCSQFTQLNNNCALTAYGLGIAYDSQEDTTQTLKELEQLQGLSQDDLVNKLKDVIAK